MRMLAVLMMMLTAQGSLLTYNSGQTSGFHGGKRGKITGFSSPSRRRLIKLFASFDTLGVNTKFVTLTFARYPTPERAKAALKALLMRWRRAYPEMAAVWRMEYQDRGSIHFHLITFNLPFVEQRGLQADWGQIAARPVRKIRRFKRFTTTIRPKMRRSLYIVNIKAVRGKKGLFSYLSKYVAKIEDETIADESFTSIYEGSYQHAHAYTGRVWGYCNRAGLPFGKLIEWSLKSVQVARYMRHAIRVLSGFRAGKMDNGFFLSDDAYDMLFAAMKFEAADTEKLE